MKRLFITFFIIFISAVCHADTVNLKWLNDDGTTYSESTCDIGNDLIIPTTPPTKYGHTFTGWRISGYTPIEYLKSTGSQFIDTGIQVNSDYTIDVKGKFVCGASLLGRDGSGFGSSNDFLVFIACSSGASSWGTGSVESTQQILGLDSGINTLKINKYGIYINEIQKISFLLSGSIKYASGRLLLFATRGAYGWGQNSLISVKIFNENDTLVRDFIPVLDENNVPCMFDRVESKFYYNAGTGDFIAGPVL